MDAGPTYVSLNEDYVCGNHLVRQYGRRYVWNWTQPIDVTYRDYSDHLKIQIWHQSHNNQVFVIGLASLLMNTLCRT